MFKGVCRRLNSRQFEKKKKETTKVNMGQEKKYLLLTCTYFLASPLSEMGISTA